MKSSLGLKLALVFFACIMQVSAQIKLIEKVVKKGDELVIPYEKYQLTNGLTLLIHEDHSDPIVYVNVMYHVGSGREQEGRSGFAHLFEHMMFEGSDHVAGGQHLKIITEAGGKNNGSTNNDATDYWNLIPSNQLETVLWLESDRMGFFLDSVTDQKFKIQKEVIKNERSQNIDNRPYGLVNEKIAEALYPHSHPYARLPIGYTNDLDYFNTKDLKDFFLRWYGPNNATLTIAGDVSPAAVVKLVEKYFSTINSGPIVNPLVFTPVILDNDRYVSYVDKVDKPQVTFTFPTIPNRHPDEAALDILAEMLGEGKTSVFYQYFVKSEDAESLEITHPCYELAGEFRIKILAKRLKNFDIMLKEAFAKFEKNGVTQEDLEKFKTRYEVKKMDQMQSINGKGHLLAFYQNQTRNPNYISKDFDRYNNVTKEDVMRVYKSYIKDKYSVIISAVPKANFELIKNDNYTILSRNKNTAESNEYKNLTNTKPKDNFDRKKQPIPGAAPIVKVPDFWIDSLQNGLKIIGSKSDELPSVFIKISIEAGHRFESRDQEGISELLALMLKESTTKYSTEEIDLKLNRLGSKINITSTSDQINFYVSSLTRNFDSTLAILEEMILHPKFDPHDFQRIQVKQVNLLFSAAFNPKELLEKLIYGKTHILGNSSHGTREIIARISTKELKEYYENNCVPSFTSIVFVGNLNKEEVMTKLTFLKSWKDTIVNHPSVSPPDPISKTSISFVNMPNFTQAKILIGCMGLPYDATGEYYKSYIATYALGASSSSRINLNLRQQHGYSYSAVSSFSGNKYPGPYIIEADVKDSATDSALIEMMNEIKKYADKGITKQELLFTQNSMVQQEVLKYETPFQKADFLNKILDYKLSKDFAIKQNVLLRGITIDELNSIAKKCLPYNNMSILVVGNRVRVLAKLSKLGYQVNEINFYGTILNTY